QANQPRPDVNAAYPGVGDNHGFSGTVTTTKRGSVPVYIYAINIGAGTNVLIGTKTVTVGAPPGNPIGHVDSVSASTATLGQLSIGGWALDGDAATQATQVHIYVGGPAGTAGAELFGLQANQTRSDVGAAYPGVGDNHGFSSTIVTAKRGSVPVYIYAINIGAGSNVLIGTKTVMVGAPLGNPIGHVDAYSNSNGNLNVSGWAVDGDSPATPITIHVYENGPAGTGTLLTAFTAGLSRPDVNIAYPGIGNNHGFSQTLNIHSASIVYIYAINIGSGTNVLIGTNAQPVLRGIDVSYWNGGGDNPSTPAINWAAVAQSGIRFAMLRAGWIGTDGVFNVDSTYAFNVRNARANGVLVGAYIYEYSSNYNTQSAGISAFASYTRSQGIILDLPVALDVEDSIYKAGTDANGGYSYMTNLIRSGMLQLRALGYKPAFYTSLNWAQTEFDATQLEKESNTFWLASWYNNNAELSPNTITWNGGYPGIWQYRSTGSVSGITGNVDMDYLYPNKLN
ncbi:MAG: hypothetical protein FWF33_02245, partial [Clostridiales bacterium]|nr:hypothetical protein [Clostridiales bacterium]